MNIALSRQSFLTKALTLFILCIALIGTQACTEEKASVDEASTGVANAVSSTKASGEILRENPASENSSGAELATTCSACHGDNGLSQNPLWPNLAGQKEGYLAAQITAFRNGDREEPTMAPFVKDLTEAQVNALAEHFSALPAAKAADASNANQNGMNVRANCMACHGVAGITVNEQWPNLAGQQADYLAKQLRAYRDGSREAALMNVIAADLSDQQIADVAEYYSQLAE